MFTLSLPERVIFGVRLRGQQPSEAKVIYDGPVLPRTIIGGDFGGMRVALYPWHIGRQDQHQFLSYACSVENTIAGSRHEGPFFPGSLVFSALFSSSVPGGMHVTSLLQRFFGIEAEINGGGYNLTGEGCWASFDARISNMRPIGRGQRAFFTFEVACAKLSFVNGQALEVDVQKRPWVSLLTNDDRARLAPHQQRISLEHLQGKSELSKWLRGEQEQIEWQGFGASGEKGRFGPLLGGPLDYASLASVAELLQAAYLPLVEECRRPWHMDGIPSVPANEPNSCYMFGSGIHWSSKFQEPIADLGRTDRVDGPNSEHFEVASLRIAESFPGNKLASSCAWKASEVALHVLASHAIEEGGYAEGGYWSLRATGRCLGTILYSRTIAAYQRFAVWLVGSPSRPAKVPEDFGRRADPGQPGHVILVSGVPAERIVEIWQLFSWAWIFRADLATFVRTHGGSAAEQALEVWRGRIVDLICEAWKLPDGFPKFTVAGRPDLGREYSKREHFWMLPLLRAAIRLGGYGHAAELSGIAGSIRDDWRAQYGNIDWQLETFARYDATVGDNSRWVTLYL